MRNAVLGIVAAGTLAAQSVGGPVLGYVVDDGARLRPIYGSAASAHVGAAVREGVKDSWGELALLTDGTGVHAGKALEGNWAAVQPGALLDATGRSLLIVGEGTAPWRLALPERALTVRVSASGARALTLMADGSLAAWSAGGKAEWRLAASVWWSVTYAGERALAYDPAANTVLELGTGGELTVLRKLEGAGGRYELGIDMDGKFAVLLGEQALVAPLGDGPTRTVTLPEGSNRLEAVQGGKAFLLTRDPARPMWILDPAREEPLLVIPALGVEKGARP